MTDTAIDTQPIKQALLNKHYSEGSVLRGRVEQKIREGLIPTGMRREPTVKEITEEEGDKIALSVTNAGAEFIVENTPEGQDPYKRVEEMGEAIGYGLAKCPKPEFLNVNIKYFDEALSERKMGNGSSPRSEEEANAIRVGLLIRDALKNPNMTSIPFMATRKNFDQFKSALQNPNSPIRAMVIELRDQLENQKDPLTREKAIEIDLQLAKNGIALPDAMKRAKIELMETIDRNIRSIKLTDPTFPMVNSFDALKLLLGEGSYFSEEAQTNPESIAAAIEAKHDIYRLMNEKRKDLEVIAQAEQEKTEGKEDLIEAIQGELGNIENRVEEPVNIAAPEPASEPTPETAPEPASDPNPLTRQEPKRKGLFDFLRRK